MIFIFGLARKYLQEKKLSNFDSMKNMRHRKVISQHWPTSLETIAGSNFAGTREHSPTLRAQVSPLCPPEWVVVLNQPSHILSVPHNYSTSVFISLMPIIFIFGFAKKYVFEKNRSFWKNKILLKNFVVFWKFWKFENLENFDFFMKIFEIFENLEIFGFSKILRFFDLRKCWKFSFLDQKKSQKYYFIFFKMA